jgi:polygalacturonase
MSPCLSNPVGHTLREDDCMDSIWKDGGGDGKSRDLPFAIPEISLPGIPEYSVNVTDFGAVGDGITLNTNAFAQAVEACARAGGGTVVIPEGVWLTGPIVLRSKIRLHAESGALISFSRSYEDYPLVLTNYEGNAAVRCQSPISGENLEDIAITGEGIFDGSGEVWRPVKRSKMTESAWKGLLASGGALEAGGAIWWPTEAAARGAELVSALRRKGSMDPADYEPVREYLRPNLLSLRNCRRVLLEGVTFQNSPAWCLHPWNCEEVTVRRVKVRNPWYAQNGDGLDLESCRKVQVLDSTFDVGDDAICMKSGKNEQGRRLGLPCEDIEIRGCTVYHGHGGFVVGSEMSGGVRRIAVSDCTFIGTDVGLRFKSTRGRGGVVEQIYIDRIRMKDIVKEAISFNLFYEGRPDDEAPRPVSEETPQFRDIRIRDTVCIGAMDALVLRGLPEMPIESVAFERLVLEAVHGIRLANGRNLAFYDCTVQARRGPAVAVHQCEEVRIDPLRNFCGDAAALQVSGERSRDIGFRGDPAMLSIGGDVRDGAVIDLDARE